MVAIGKNLPPLEQTYQYGNYGQGKSAVPFGGYTVNPTRVAGVDTSNQYNISIPKNHSYVMSENGDKISTGNDGVGLAHKNPDEYNFHLIA